MVNSDELRQIARRGETLTVEFKAAAINDTELVEAVACLANGSGGLLLIGVADDGSLVGAKPRHGTTTEPSRLEALIAHKTEPSLVAKAQVVAVGDVDVIVVEVPASASVTGTSEGKFVRRAIDVRGNPQCLPMRPHEVVARAGSIGVSATGSG